MKLRIFICMIIILFTGQAFAGYVFYDDFNLEHGGIANSTTLNYTSFINWTVSDGTVDLIGNGYYDFLPGNGLYVDMDGSTGDAGKLTTYLDLNAGSYILSFDLAGNHNSSDYEEVDVLVDGGTLFAQGYSLSQNVPFTTFTGIFNVVTPGTYSLSFEGMGGDNVGMLLDDVSVSLVPVPATILLGLVGLGIGGWKLRKSI